MIPYHARVWLALRLLKLAHRLMPYHHHPAPVALSDAFCDLAIVMAVDSAALRELRS